MQQEGFEQTIEYAQKRLIQLRYQYSQILESDLDTTWREVNNLLFSYFDEDDRCSREQSECNDLLQAVVQLEDTCKKVAKEWETKQKKNPRISHLFEYKKLTNEDKEFIKKRRHELASVTPEIGSLSYYFETGTEGAYWSFDCYAFDSYNSLRILEEGDHLVIYNFDGTILFDEVLLKDTESGWLPYHEKYPYGYGQQVCANVWVHWIPKGWSSCKWAELFYMAQGKRAELYRSRD